MESNKVLDPQFLNDLKGQVGLLKYKFIEEYQILKNIIF